MLQLYFCGILLFLAGCHGRGNIALKARQEAEVVASGTGEETTGTAIVAPAAASGAPTANGKEVVGYWSNWRVGFSPMEDIPYKDLTILHYFVAVPDAAGTIISDRPDEIKGFVDAAHAANPDLVVSISLFGWGGSVNASAIIKDPAIRKTFVDNLVELVNTNGLDAIEYDWEYPGPNEEQGTPCNTRDVGDVANFQTLLTEVKALLPEVKQFAAVSAAGPWYETADAHYTDLSAFVPLLDLILIMTYDVVGGWSDVAGPNSPLSVKGCTDPAGLASIGKLSVEDAVAAWVAAKYPASQLLVGLSSYGRGFSVGTGAPGAQESGEASGTDAVAPDSAATAALPTDVTAAPLFRRADEALAAGNLFMPQSGLLPGDNFTQPDGEKQVGDKCPGTEATDTGIFLYRTLAEYAEPEWVDYWDECTVTPFMMSQDESQLISYDNPRSICEKMKFTREQGLAGVAIFDLAGLDEAGAFLDAVISETEDCSTLSTAAIGTPRKGVEDPEADADVSGSGVVSGKPKPTKASTEEDAVDGEEEDDGGSASASASFSAAESLVGDMRLSSAAMVISQVLAAAWYM